MDDILDYVSSYDDIRAVLGVDIEELSDDVLGLAVYRDRLHLSLSNTSGIYAAASTSELNLLEIFEAIGEDDEMHMVIRQLATYLVADYVADALSMISVKTKTDGKRSVVRHSAESVYMNTRAAIKAALKSLYSRMHILFDTDIDEEPLITAVGPEVDIVTGE